MRLVSKAWILFFRVSKQGPCFSMIKLSLPICTKTPRWGTMDAYNNVPSVDDPELSKGSVFKA